MDIASFARGVREALDAAAEEHDRDGYEIVCPANVRDLETVVDPTTAETLILVTMTDGARFRVRVEPVLRLAGQVTR